VTVNTDLSGQLLGVLRAAAGEPGLAYDRRPEPMHGGFWAELCSFSLAEPPDGWPKELVARVMPDPGAARKETIVQSAVAGGGDSRRRWCGRRAVRGMAWGGRS